MAAVLAWRAAPVAPPSEAALQVVWLDARRPAEPDVAVAIERIEPAREAAPPAAPMGEAITEGLEPEDMLATMLPDPIAPPPPPDRPPAREEAPPSLSELMAAAGPPSPDIPDASTGADSAAPMPPPAEAEPEHAAASADRNTELAALTVPPPAPPARAAPPSTSPPPARREQARPPRRPNAAAVPARPVPSPNPAPPPPRAEASVSAPPPPALDQPPLVHGPPRFRRPPSPPDYPAQARERGEEGSVGLRLLIGADGATREVRLHRSSGNRLLDEAALAAARRWEIEPASLDGRRAEAWVEVPVRFRLDR